MDRKQFYYKRKVTANDLNEMQEYIQDAIRAVSADMGLWGSFSGLLLNQLVTPSTSITVDLGGAYSGSVGKRIAVPTQQTLDCSVDYLGATTYTDMASGYGRWLGIFLTYAEVESDPQVDGLGATVNFEIAESFALKVYKGSSDIVANKATLARPGTVTGEIKLGDVWMERDNPNIITADIDYTERQDLYRETILGTDVSGGTFKEFITSIAAVVNSIATSDLTVDSDIIPDTDAAYDLGSGAARFKDLNLSGDAAVQDISAREITVTDEINLPGAGKKLRSPYVSTADQLKRVIPWHAGSSGDSGTLTWEPSSTRVQNVVAGANWYIPIILPPGTTLIGVYLDCEAVNSNLGEITGTLKKHDYATPGDTTIGTAQSSSSTRSGVSITGLPVVIGDDGYYVMVVNCVSTGDKIYGMRIFFKTEYWPI